MAQYYKSKYTGAKIDELLGKVESGGGSGTTDYNSLENRPIINADIPSIVGVPNTYYRQIANSQQTQYAVGKIYFYDGSKFIPVFNGTMELLGTTLYITL